MCLGLVLLMAAGSITGSIKGSCVNPMMIQGVKGMSGTIKATYGTPSCGIDVSETVAKALENPSGINPTFGSGSAGSPTYTLPDPAPGFLKTLSINFSNGTISRSWSVQEGQPLFTQDAQSQYKESASSQSPVSVSRNTRFATQIGIPTLCGYRGDAQICTLPDIQSYYPCQQKEIEKCTFSNQCRGKCLSNRGFNLNPSKGTCVNGYSKLHDDVCGMWWGPLD